MENPTPEQPLRRKKQGTYEFTGLKDQKVITKEVKIPIPHDTLVKMADRAMELTTAINEAEAQRKEHLPARIKSLEGERTALVHRYNEKKEPQVIECSVGFDYDDKAPVVTVDATKNPPEETKQEFPRGKKWFVNRKTGDVYGPEPILESDLQLELTKPETQKVGEVTLKSVREFDASATGTCGKCHDAISVGDRVVEIDGVAYDGKCGDVLVAEMKAAQPPVAAPRVESDEAREKGARVTSLDSRRKKKQEPKKTDGDGKDHGQ